MKYIPLVPVSAVFMLMSLPTLHATPQSTASEANETLKQVDFLARQLAETADGLQAISRNELDPSANLESIEILKDDVNKIGEELRVLNAERDSLAPWQIRALDQVTSLMSMVAENTTQAIRSYDPNPARLRLSSFFENNAAISQNAGQVANLLHDYLTLSAMRGKERRIEHSLGAAGGF